METTQRKQKSGLTFKIMSNHTLRVIKWMIEKHGMTYESISERSGLPVTIIKSAAEGKYRRQRVNDAIRLLEEEILSTPIDFNKAADRLRDRTDR